jgi:dienelactone hydrolase
MTVLLFHHALGLTDGVRAFADRLRAAGHTVHTPDLYGGRVFTSLPDGLAFAKEVKAQDLAVRAADSLPADLVYIGHSLGVMAAQRLAQTRPGARGAVLLEACVPPEHFGDGWPADLPVQVHGMDGDEFFAGDGDLDAARDLVKNVRHGELFVYPGDGHLFIDSSLPAYDASAADLVVARVLEFLKR